MDFLRALPSAVLLGALASMLSGCSLLGFRIRSPITRVAEESRFGPERLTAATIQSELMSFTDTFDAAVAEHWNRVAAESRAVSDAETGESSDEAQQHARRVRRAAIENKLATVSAALSIASSPNPVVGLADMVTMITLQRMVLDSPATVERYGAETASDLLAMQRAQEEKIWRIAARAMSVEQQQELKGLIAEWRAENPEAKYVANVRLEDFAKARQQSIVEGKHSGDSLLALIALDPLAGLDPAQREVQKSRMLGERVFFYGSRMPQVLKWQVESLSQDLLRAPELVQVSSSIEKVTDSLARVTSVAERLPEEVATARSAALEDLFAKLADARRAAVDDIAQAVSAQRAALLEDLDSAQGTFRSTLVEFRETADTTDRAATALSTTIRAADAFAARFQAPPGSGPRPQESDRNVFANYQAAVTQTGDAADRLTTLAQNIDGLLESPALDEKSAALQTALVDVQSRAEDVIDYAFVRLLIVALVTPFAVALAAGLYRRANRRRGANHGARGRIDGVASMSESEFR